jgi:HEAT repeat protein
VERTAPAVQRLVDLLGDADPDVRLRAALDIAEARDERAAADLVARFGRVPALQVRGTRRGRCAAGRR